jgi:hypothetical protein
MEEAEEASGLIPEPTKRKEHKCLSALIRITGIATMQFCSRPVGILRRRRRKSQKRLDTARRRYRASSARRTFDSYTIALSKSQLSRLGQNGFHALRAVRSQDIRCTTHRRRKRKMIGYRHILTHAAREPVQCSAMLTSHRRIDAHVIYIWWGHPQEGHGAV